MISKLKVTKLNGKISKEYNFNFDLNILSGKNGCGKTTLLKLMWYMMSGNFERLFEEIDFEYARLDYSDGDFLELIVRMDGDIKKVKINARDHHSRYDEEIPVSKINSTDGLIPDTYNSLFFPTFRRIEGGFSITSKSVSSKSRIKENLLSEALESISDNLSTSDHLTEHKFIASISTTDINYLLSERYAEMSDEIREIEELQSKEILKIVANSRDKEKESLEDIRAIVRKTDTDRSEVFRPFVVLSRFIDNIFKNKSIKITNNLKLGDAKDAIISENLSAGEKQMLSFLCYNFFYDNSVIFIDEPELSLHTDWQRLLFPTLLKQGKKNQFMIATHSPFIYTNYPDKEILLDEDKGD